jgi:predicted transposase/invertase (TIGR01784 family)
LDVERYTEEELLSLSNTIGAVFLLDQTANQELLLERLRKLTNTIRRMPEDMQTQFMNWLVNMIASQLPAESRDVQQMIRELKESGVSIMGLQKNLEAIRQRGFEEGIEKGFEKGYEQGILQVAKRLIDMGLDNSAIAAATGLSQDKIERLRNPFRS